MGTFNPRSPRYRHAWACNQYELRDWDSFRIGQRTTGSCLASGNTVEANKPCPVGCIYGGHIDIDRVKRLDKQEASRPVQTIAKGSEPEESTADYERAKLKAALSTDGDNYRVSTGRFRMSRDEILVAIEHGFIIAAVGTTAKGTWITKGCQAEADTIRADFEAEAVRDLALAAIKTGAIVKGKFSDPLMLPYLLHLKLAELRHQTNGHDRPFITAAGRKRIRAI